MRFLIYLLCIVCLGQVMNAKKSESNIVLSGGSGCKGGNGALVMENGKGKLKQTLKLDLVFPVTEN